MHSSRRLVGFIVAGLLAAPVGFPSLVSALTLELPTPGQYGLANRLTVIDAAPDQELLLLVATEVAVTPVPGCADLNLDVKASSVAVAQEGIAEANGQFTWTLEVPEIAREQSLFFQVVSQSACEVSPLVEYLFERHPLDDHLSMNEIQMRGTHNSYHVEPLIPFDPSHRYTHAPLDEQLGPQGVRAFEIDIHRGLFGGWQVYHITVIDQASTCDQLEECLRIIQTWSAERPEHAPLIVWIEAKDDAGGLPIDDLGPVDDIIRDVFEPQQLLTPDALQGSFGSVRERLDTAGWPTLGEVRGQVLFVLLDTGSKAEDYTFGYTSLAGRAMFANATADQLEQGWAAFRKINDPTQATEIAAAIDAGFMVASNVCNADESDAQCSADLVAGKDNGVHMLKDDFPAPVSDRDYWLELPDGRPVRCNPATASADCNSLSLEDLVPVPN